MISDITCQGKKQKQNTKSVILAMNLFTYEHRHYHLF